MQFNSFTPVTKGGKITYMVVPKDARFCCTWKYIDFFFFFLKFQGKCIRKF